MCIRHGGTKSHGLFDSFRERVRLRLHGRPTNSTCDRRRVANEMHSIPFLPNESGPVRKVIRLFLTAKVRLVSEASVGDGKHLHFVLGNKAAVEE